MPLEHRKANEWISTDDNSRLWKTIKHYGRIREYRKEKLDNISK